MGKWGKEHLKHDVHHSYKHGSEMFTWSGYAFEAIDGSLQGLPLVIGTLLVPIPSSFHIFSGAFVGVWTMYILTGTVVSLPWPFMGSDYHLIHHGLNWYNFGLYNVLGLSLWDTETPVEETRQVDEASPGRRKIVGGAACHVPYGRHIQGQEKMSLCPETHKKTYAQPDRYKI